MITLASGPGLPERVFKLREQVKDVPPAQVSKFEAPDVPAILAMNPLLKPKTASTPAPASPFLTPRSDTNSGPTAKASPFLRR